MWCRYYKALENGKLKFGDGPGAGPASTIGDLLAMLRKLIEMGVLDKESAKAALDD